MDKLTRRTAIKQIIFELEEELNQKELTITDKEFGFIHGSISVYKLWLDSL